MNTSGYEFVECKGDGCNSQPRVGFAILDHLGGRYYCEDCRESGSVPEGHPQHPDFDGEFPL